MPEVAYAVANSQDRMSPLFVGRQLIIHLCHSRCFPHRASTRTVSNDSEVRPESGWVLWLGLFVQSSRMMKIEHNASFSVTSMQPQGTPTNALQPNSSDAVCTLVSFVLE
jgi:hypothetical protein